MSCPQGSVAEQHLEAAIRMDPQDASVWRMLAQVYRSEHARERLDELARRYRMVFSAPLPP
jgi:Tfp pilus assembly protein PilF